MFKLVIKGIPETTAMLNGIVSQAPTNKKAIVKEISDLMVSRAKTNAHVITGNMRANISSRTVSDSEAIVTAAAQYSAVENRRPGIKFAAGPHNFWDRAFQTVIKDVPSILSRHAYKWTGFGSKGVKK